MNQTQRPYWEAIKIGFLLSAAISILAFIFWPASWSFTIFSLNAPLAVALFGILGALAGQLFLKTQKGAWMGAAITLVLLFWWLYAIASTGAV